MTFKKCFSSRKYSWKSICTLGLVRLLTSEFLACFIFQFVCHIIQLSFENKIYSAITKNLLYAVLIQNFIQIRAGIISPALSLAILIDKRIHWLKCALLCIVQPLGVVIGNCAYMSFAAIENMETKAFDLPVIDSPYSQSFLCLVEAIATVLFVICWLTVTPRDDYSKTSKSACVPIFGVLTCNSLWAGSITGSSMNPINELISYFMFSPGSSDGYKLWIFIVGPTVGAVLGAAFYRFVLRTDEYLERFDHDSRNGNGYHRAYRPPSRPSSSRGPLISQSTV